MAADFDPYHKWLGIPPTQQPPHHYRLLGVDLFESDADVIANAADRQMGHVRSMASGPYAAFSQRMLNELATAKLCLLDPRRKAAYDAHLSAPRPLVAVPGGTAAQAGAEPPVYASVVAATQDDDDAAWDDAATPEISARARRRGRRSSLGLGIRLCGHVAASVAGLALGYWVLCAIGPQYDFLGLVANAAPEEQSGARPDGSTAAPPQLPTTDVAAPPGINVPRGSAQAHVSGRQPGFGAAPAVRPATGVQSPPGAQSRPSVQPPRVTPGTSSAAAARPAGTLPSPAPQATPSAASRQSPPVERTEVEGAPQDFPQHVDLPPSAEVGEVPLGIPLGAQFAALRLDLLANPLAEDDLRRPRLREDAASGGGRQWSVLLAADGASLDSLHAVGRFVLRGGELYFAWTPEAAAEANAGQLRNALLNVATQGETRAVALRSPLRLSPLTFTLEQKKTLLRLDLPDAPSAEQLRLIVAVPGSPVPGQLDPPDGAVPFGKRVVLAIEPGVELRLLSSTTTSGPVLTLSGVYRLPEMNAEAFTTEQLAFHKGTLEKQLSDARGELSQRVSSASSLPGQLQAVIDRPLPSGGALQRQAAADRKNKEINAIRKEIRKNSRLLDSLKLRIPKIEANLTALESVVQLSARLDKQVSLRVRLEYEVAGRKMLLATIE